MDRTTTPGRRAGTGLRRPAAVAVLAVAWAASLVAAAAPAHADLDVAFLHGVITDASTGDPVAGVCVWTYHRCAGAGDLSAADGSFQRTVEVPWASQEATVKVSPAATDAYHEVQTVTLTYEEYHAAHLELHRLGRVSGRVRSASTGAPVAGVCASAPGFGGHVGPGHCSDADGVWVLARMHPGPSAVISLAGERYQDAYVGGGVRLAAARRFDLRQGDNDLPDTFLREEATVVRPGGGAGSRLIAVRVGSGGSDLVPARRDLEAPDLPGAPQWSLEPGRYRLGFSTPTSASNGDECREGAVCPDPLVVWYPGTVDPGAATPVQLAPGATFSYAAPAAGWRDDLTITVRGLPADGTVQARFVFASGAPFEQSFTYGATAGATGNAVVVARYLPRSPLKVRLVVPLPDGGTRTLWYGGSTATDAELVPTSAVSISVQVPKGR